MRFGLLEIPANSEGHHHQKVYGEWLERIVLADRLGFDSVWLSDHHFYSHSPPIGIGGFPSIAVQSGIVAANTKRVRIGQAVVVLPLYHPILVAEDFSIIDNYSGGRLNFGIGSGNPGGLAYTGLGANGENIQARMDECLDIILKSWTLDKFSYSGKFYSFPEVTVVPKPLQKPHPPVWQVVISQETMKRVAQRGIHPIMAATQTTFEELKEKYFEPWSKILKELGKDPRTTEMGHSQWIYVGETNEKALQDVARAVKMYFTGRPLVYKKGTPLYELWSKISQQPLDEITRTRLIAGDPDTVIEKIRYLNRECGVNHLLCNMALTEGVPQDKILQSMRLFSEHVIPAFQGNEIPMEVSAVRL